MWCTAVGVGVGVASSVAAVVALAWVRLRRCGRSTALDAHQQQQPQEMEWDNSAFNITVNPLDCDVRLFIYLHRLLVLYHGRPIFLAITLTQSISRDCRLQMQTKACDGRR